MAHQRIVEVGVNPATSPKDVGLAGKISSGTCTMTYVAAETRNEEFRIFDGCMVAHRSRRILCQ